MFVDVADWWVLCYLNLNISIRCGNDHRPCTLPSSFWKLQDEESETPEETGKLPESVSEEFFSLPRFEGSALYPCVALSNHSCILAVGCSSGSEYPLVN